MICPTCNGSGWMKQGFPGGFRPTQCHTCGGHGELVPPISLFECVECGKKMNKCKCKPLAERMEAGWGAGGNETFGD